MKDCNGNKIEFGCPKEFEGFKYYGLAVLSTFAYDDNTPRAHSYRSHDGKGPHEYILVDGKLQFYKDIFIDERSNYEKPRTI